MGSWVKTSARIAHTKSEESRHTVEACAASFNQKKLWYVVSS